MTALFDHHFLDEEFAERFAEAGFIDDTLEEVCRYMKKQNIDHTELARRMGEGNDIKLRTLARIVHVLGGKPVFKIGE